MSLAAVTDARGEYRLPKLPPGKYKMQAELSGFATAVVPSVELLVGQTGAVPFLLQVASIGTEITTGQCLDTNCQWLSLRLSEIGIPVCFHTTIDDDLADDVAGFRTALDRADVVLCTGAE